jgi:hypothetical protein
MIKMRSRKYSASWQTNTTHSIRYQSQSMRKTSLSEHYFLLMHRQEDSICAVPIKSKITSRWEALTEKRGPLPIRINVATLSFTCPNRRLQLQVLPVVSCPKAAQRRSLNPAVLKPCIGRRKRCLPIIKISRTKPQLSKIEKALLPKLILS